MNHEVNEQLYLTRLHLDLYMGSYSHNRWVIIATSCTCVMTKVIGLMSKNIKITSSRNDMNISIITVLTHLLFASTYTP